MIKFKFIPFLFLSCLVAANANAGASPYAGQQQRDIKALSPAEVTGLTEGKGMGLAKAAELNHYPGPKHVMELVAQLNLSKQQQEQTKQLFLDMKKEAVAVGNIILEKEKVLDGMFSSGTITKAQLKKVVNDIGILKGQLRYIHLKTHLEQKRILSHKQVKHYDMLRGYNDKKGQHKHQHEH